MGSQLVFMRLRCDVGDVGGSMSGLTNEFIQALGPAGFQPWQHNVHRSGRSCCPRRAGLSALGDMSQNVSGKWPKWKQRPPPPGFHEDKHSIAPDELSNYVLLIKVLLSRGLLRLHPQLCSISFWFLGKSAFSVFVFLFFFFFWGGGGLFG